VLAGQPLEHVRAGLDGFILDGIHLRKLDALSVKHRLAVFSNASLFEHLVGAGEQG